MGTVSKNATSEDRLNSPRSVSTDGRPKVNPRIPYYSNLIFPPWYFFTIFSVWYYGFFVVFPYIYEDSPWLLANRIFSTFVFLEMMINWVCICFVDSTFGRPPGTRKGRPRAGRPGSTDVAVGPLTEPVPQSIVSRKEVCSEFPSLGENKMADTKYYRTSDGSVIVSMVTVPSSPNQELPHRTTYPYFSWKPCLVCDRMRPPRCHHCMLCQKCVLKRDHHCYFAGACVGLYNQRHFIVFTFWASIATVYALVHSLPYIYYDFLQQTSYVDLFLPLTYFRLIFGYTELKIAILMTMEWSLVCFVFFSVMFFSEQVILVSRSLTTFENENRVNLHDTRDFSGKVRAVFGDNWPLQFLVPLHMWFDPAEDAINWPHIKR